jgi:hypothetical protein
MQVREKPMLKSILVSMLFVSISCCGFPVWSAQTQGPQKAESDQFNTSAERIGELRLDQPEKDLSGKISCKPKKGKEILEGATGEYVQTWKYPDCGISLKMSSTRKGGAKVVRSITIITPSDLSTSGGIHIGSTESEVLKAYGRYRDKDGGTQKGVRFVAGSIFDGMIFDFKDGKVVGIFIGAAAE